MRRCKRKSTRQLIEDIQRRTKRIMATLQDLKDQIAAIETAVEADVAQDIKVIAAIEALLKALEAAGTTEFQAEVDALKAVSSKLSSDNQAVQDAIDKAPA